MIKAPFQRINSNRTSVLQRTRQVGRSTAVVIDVIVGVIAIGVISDVASTLLRKRGTKNDTQVVNEDIIDIEID